MKKIILLLVTIASSQYTHAQDQLFKKDNTKLLVRITEVSIDEIKYKLFDNLNGPTYTLNRSEISIVIYENGKHEVFSTPDPSVDQNNSTKNSNAKKPDYKKDSLNYYRYSRSLSINFLNYANNELGFIYQQEFFKKNFNLVIPFAIGVEKPNVTEAAYFKDNTYYSNNNYSELNLQRKLFEIGMGVNYYSSLKGAFNYYIGPVLKFMQYSAEQIYTYRIPYGSYITTTTIKQSTNLNRYTGGISNGLMFRTKNRLVMNIFASLGFKYDQVSSMVTDPTTKKSMDPIDKAVAFYFWSGVCVGYSF